MGKEELVSAPCSAGSLEGHATSRQRREDNRTQRARQQSATRVSPTGSLPGCGTLIIAALLVDEFGRHVRAVAARSAEESERLVEFKGERVLWPRRNRSDTYCRRKGKEMRHL